MLRFLCLKVCLIGSALAGCQTEGGDPLASQMRHTPLFDNIDITSHSQFNVKIQPQEETCHGPFFEFACYRGTTDSGEEILFYSEIKGYTHKIGQSAELRVERIKYDPMDPNFPADFFGEELFLIKMY